MISFLRRVLQCFQLRSASVSRPVQCLLAVLFLPFFLIFMMLVWLRFALRGPWRETVATQFGTRMNCLLPDAVQLYVYLFGIWEPDITAYVRRTLQPGETFVDVGAHVGYYTLLASQLVGPAGRVVSIEASPMICALLRENIALNNGAAANVRFVNAAAAATAGELSIHLGPAWNLGWSTTLSQRGFAHEARVPAEPLETLVSEEEMRAARLIKIDVEGNERDVFAGMTRWLLNCRPDAEFLVELSPLWWRDGDTSLEGALAPFLATGFQAYRIDNSYLPWRLLWPFTVRSPRRVRGPMQSWIGQVDLVLSRRDAEEL